MVSEELADRDLLSLRVANILHLIAHMSGQAKNLGFLNGAERRILLCPFLYIHYGLNVRSHLKEPVVDSLGTFLTLDVPDKTLDIDKAGKLI